MTGSTEHERDRLSRSTSTPKHPTCLQISIYGARGRRTGTGKHPGRSRHLCARVTPETTTPSPREDLGHALGDASRYWRSAQPPVLHRGHAFRGVATAWAPDGGVSGSERGDTNGNPMITRPNSPCRSRRVAPPYPAPYRSHVLCAPYAQPARSRRGVEGSFGRPIEHELAAANGHDVIGHDPGTLLDSDGHSPARRHGRLERDTRV